MKRFNLGRGRGRGFPEEEALPPEGQGPQRRRLLILALVGIILVSVAWVVTKFLLFPAPPPPPPPQVVRVPPPPRPPAPPAPAAPKEAAEAKPPSAKEPEAEAPKAPPPEPAKAVKPSPRYSLQVGAMIYRPNAVALKERLEGLGYTVRIRKSRLPKTRYIVYMGESAPKPEAEAAASQLNQDGFPARLVPAGDRFLVEVGSFLDLNEAIDLAHELQKKNYLPKILDRPVQTVFYQVRVGPFPTRAEALKKGEELKAKGLATFVIKD